MDIPCKVARQLDSALWTMIMAGREGIDGGSAGDNMIPYGPRLKTHTTAWRSRTSDIDEMLYLARSRVRVGSNPVPGQANLYFLGWTDDVDNPDPEVSPFPTVREFEEASWVALGLVIGKTSPRNATDQEDVETPSGALPRPQEALKRPNGAPRKHETTRVGNKKMSVRTFERQEIEERQESLI
jgi:hypothetical protein